MQRNRVEVAGYLGKDAQARLSAHRNQGRESAFGRKLHLH